jgi:hypothetical protein
LLKTAIKKTKNGNKKSKMAVILVKMAGEKTKKRRREKTKVYNEKFYKEPSYK